MKKPELFNNSKNVHFLEFLQLVLGIHEFLQLVFEILELIEMPGSVSERAGATFLEILEIAFRLTCFIVCLNPPPRKKGEEFQNFQEAEEIQEKLKRFKNFKK